MRIHLFVRNAFLLLALASPLLIRAQFQQPSSDELKMTADPKTPGAAAVYLNLEEITDDPQHFHSVYARIDMHYADQVNDKVVYRLPAGLAVEGAPQDEKIPWESEAVLSIQTMREPGQITVIRSLARAFTLVKPMEYLSLHDFYRKVAAIDQQQLVLTTVPPAKGN